MSGFHLDDGPAIASNESIQHLSSIPEFFVNPRISSTEKASAFYAPLLSSWFAIDYALEGGVKPFLFQLENFFWFAALITALFLLFRLVPGVSNLAAGFAAMLFGLHPGVADTVNYALQQGVIMGAFGVASGMVVWIVWPERLPQKLPLKLKRVPEHGFDEYLRHNYDRLEALYLKIIHAPVGLYLWPVVPALLCDASAAVFAPILAVYILLFETKRKLTDAIPAGIVCVGYWIFHLVFARNVGESLHPPLLRYWLTEPWVAMRYLFRFFAPVHLSVESDLNAFAHLWDPLALAGCLGVAALIGIAIYTGRKNEWRSVSFGIWWFLLALIPDAVTPHRAVEADWRMFLPFAGLALAVAGVISSAGKRMPDSPFVAGEPDLDQLAKKMPAAIAMGILAAAVLGLAGWGTFQRNTAWASEAALWTNAVAASPQSGRAWMHFAVNRAKTIEESSLDVNGSDSAADSELLRDMRRAVELAPHDPVVEIGLAQAYIRLGQKSDAENTFRKATKDDPSFSPAWSSFAQWLLSESRPVEASEMAAKALALDPYDLAGRKTTMDAMAQQNQWKKLKQFASDTLRLLPYSADAQRSIEVAQTGVDQVKKAEKQAETQPTVDHYLALSVLYFQSEQYDDCINAARAALKLNPDLGEAWSNIASAYHAEGKLDDTIAALREEVRINPDLPSAKSNLAFELAAKEAGAGH